MKKLYASADRVLIYHLKNLLTVEGCDCVVKNDLMYSLAGEVPVNEVWPELWVLHDAQLIKAEKIISDQIKPEQTALTYWQCRQCGEQHESQFTECWNCGRDNADSRQLTK